MHTRSEVYSFGVLLESNVVYSVLCQILYSSSCMCREHIPWAISLCAEELHL